jgi:hypothetical protein
LLLFNETAIVLSSSALPGSQELIDDLSCGRSPGRLIPLPRPVIRYIARCSKVATIKTMIAYCVRGLSLSRSGEVRGKGTAKASWIADTCGFSLRAVRVARAELIEEGFITRDEGSKQWKLNRHGAYFAINLRFGVGRDSPAPAALVAASNLQSAPPEATNCIRSAPPYKNLETPFGSKNQTTRSGEQVGLWKRGGKAPDLRSLSPDDILRLSSLRLLFDQAVKARWLSRSEANFQNFVAAAVRAVRAQGDSVRIFVSIVRRQLWHHITLDQERRASEMIRRARVRMARGVESSPKVAESRQQLGSTSSERAGAGFFAVGTSELLRQVISAGNDSRSTLPA